MGAEHPFSSRKGYRGLCVEWRKMLNDRHVANRRRCPVPYTVIPIAKINFRKRHVTRATPKFLSTNLPMLRLYSDAPKLARPLLKIVLSTRQEGNKSTRKTVDKKVLAPLTCPDWKLSQIPCSVEASLKAGTRWCGIMQNIIIIFKKISRQ